MNRIQYTLTFGAFGVITTEFGIIGILPPIADHFAVSTARAGQLVSLFALIVAASGPFMTLAASRFNRKKVMQSVLLVFVLSNILSALSTGFGMLLFARTLPAFFLPVFFSTALVAAVNSVTKEEETKAVAALYGGLSVAVVAGIPLFTYLASIFTWKASFWAAAAINGIAFTALCIAVPSLPVKEKLSYARQLGILTKPALWLSISTVCLLSAGSFSVYSYFAEYLEAVFGMNGGQISSMLLLFGLTGIGGNYAAGLALNKSLPKTMVTYLTCLGLTFLLLYTAGVYPHIRMPVIAVWGFVHGAGFVIGQVWIAATAPEAPAFASSLTVSFANLGIAAGAAFGGLVIKAAGIYMVLWSAWVLLGSALLIVIIQIKTGAPSETRPVNQNCPSGPC